MAKSLSTSQGKGLTVEAAKCSALMESIEVYFAEELTPELENKSELDLTNEGITYIPVNYLSKAVSYTNKLQKFNWVKANLLLSGVVVYVPFAEFSLNSYLEEVLVYSPDTTGLAGGNNFNEALLHGMLEVIERQPTDNGVEVFNINNELFKKLTCNFECKIYYKENEYRIPSFEVLIKTKKPFENQILFKGNGCHLDKKIALNRALTEAVQSRVTTIAGSRDDLIDSKYDVNQSVFPISTQQIDFESIIDYSVKNVEGALYVLCEKINEFNQDILIHSYYAKEISILKVKLISRDMINNV